MRLKLNPPGGRIYVSEDQYIHTYLYTHTHIFIYIHISVCVCVCVTGTGKYEASDKKAGK